MTADLTSPSTSVAGTLPHACDATGDDRTAAQPARRPARSRLLGIDAARGVALLGMVAVHVLPAVNEIGEPTLAYYLSNGKAAALFALLAGVGLAFATGGPRRPRGTEWVAAVASLLVRAALVGSVGLALGTFVTTRYAAVILSYYAVMFVLAIPLLRLSPRALIATGVTIAVLVPVLSHLVRSDLPIAPQSNPTFGVVAADPAQALLRLLLTGYYPALPWMAYVCIGMALGRLSQLGSRLTAFVILIAGVSLALATRALSWLLLHPLGGMDRIEAAAATEMSADDLYDIVWWGLGGTTSTSSPWWLALDVPHSSTPFDLLHTTGVALAVLGAGLLAGRVLARLLTPLAAAGSMTLTLYSAHLFFLPSPLVPDDRYISYGLQIAALVLFALVWQRALGRGPLEAVVARASSLTRTAVLASLGLALRALGRHPRTSTA